MTRKEIEQHFKLDGGGQLRENTRYIYTDCRDVDIKVDGDFKPAPPVDGVDDSPDDTVVKVSKPYLEYPDRD